MRKLLSTIGIGATATAITLVSIVIVLRLLPAGPTAAEMEKRMNDEIDLSEHHLEEARLQACDLYATLNATCVLSRGGKACDERREIEALYQGQFTGNAAYDCDPANETPPPASSADSSSAGNPLFFGDEEVK